MTRRSKRSSPPPSSSPIGRSGALIVIERQIGLRNYIESGIPLDAMVTHDLLVTVFQTSGPLHDGAVIIQENKIAAASCFLPLTVNPTVGSDLGTRHRAAIGLTEENDAVAVVVSEETGRISVATEGQISRGFTAGDAASPSHATRASAQVGPSRAAAALTMAIRLFANLPLKVLSLLVAVVLWLAVSGQSTVERNIRVPLEYPERAAGHGDRRRPAGFGGRAAPRIVGQPRARRPGRRGGGARPHERAAGDANLQPPGQPTCGCRSACRSCR